MSKSSKEILADMREPRYVLSEDKKTIRSDSRLTGILKVFADELDNALSAEKDDMAKRAVEEIPTVLNSQVVLSVYNDKVSTHFGVSSYKAGLEIMKIIALIIGEPPLIKGSGEMTISSGSTTINLFEYPF